MLGAEELSPAMRLRTSTCNCRLGSPLLFAREQMFTTGSNWPILVICDGQKPAGAAAYSKEPTLSVSTK